MAGLADGMVIHIIPLFARSVAYDDAMVGMLVAGRFIGKLCADIPAAVIFSKLGCKWTMVLALTGTGITAAAIGTLAQKKRNCDDGTASCYRGL